MPTTRQSIVNAAAVPALGGDLTGTVGNATVSKIQGMPMTTAAPAALQSVRTNAANNCIEWYTPANGTVTSVNASGGTTGFSFTGGPITGSGTLTLAGTLSLTNGGTGATTAGGARTNLGLGSGALLNIPSPTLATLGYAIGSVLDPPTGTYVLGFVPIPAPATFALAFSGGTTGLVFSPSAAMSGSTVTVSGTLAVGSGGTGGTTTATARTNLGLGSSATFDIAPASSAATAMQVPRGDDVRIKETRYIRFLVPAAILLGANISYTIAWKRAGVDTPFADTSYTFAGAPVALGSGLNLGLKITAIDASGVTINITATLALAANAATIHLCAMHD